MATNYLGDYKLVRINSDGTINKTSYMIFNINEDFTEKFPIMPILEYSNGGFLDLDNKTVNFDGRKGREYLRLPLISEFLNAFNMAVHYKLPNNQENLMTLKNLQIENIDFSARKWPSLGQDIDNLGIRINFSAIVPVFDASYNQSEKIIKFQIFGHYIENISLARVPKNKIITNVIKTTLENLYNLEISGNTLNFFYQDSKNIDLISSDLPFSIENNIIKNDQYIFDKQEIVTSPKYQLLHNITDLNHGVIMNGKGTTYIPHANYDKNLSFPCTFKGEDITINYDFINNVIQNNIINMPTNDLPISAFSFMHTYDKDTFDSQSNGIDTPSLNIKGLFWWMFRKDIEISASDRFFFDSNIFFANTLSDFYQPIDREVTLKTQITPKPAINKTIQSELLNIKIKTNYNIGKQTSSTAEQQRDTSERDNLGFYPLHNFSFKYDLQSTKEIVNGIDSNNFPDTDAYGQPSMIQESSNFDVPTLDLEDYIPEALIRVYPYRAVYGEKDRDLISNNGVTIVRISQLGVDDFINLTNDNKGARYMLAFSAITNNTTITASSGLTSFNQELRKVKQFDLILSNYFDQIIEKPDFFTIGEPFNFDSYKDGSQQVYYSVNLKPTYPEIAQELMSEGIVIDDVNRIATATLTNVTELTSGLKSKIYFIEDKSIGDSPINELGNSGITLEVDNSILISSIKGKGKIQPIEIDGTPVGDPIFDEVNFNIYDYDVIKDPVSGFSYYNPITKPQMMPMKITPISVLDKLQIYNDWNDWNFIVPHYIIKYFKQFKDDKNVIQKGMSIFELANKIGESEDAFKQLHFNDFLLLEDLIQISAGFSDNWLSGPWKEENGKYVLDPEFYIGHGGYRVESFAGRNPKDVVDGIIESYKNKNPDFIQNKTRYQMFFGLLAALSHLIYSSYAFGGGKNQFNKVYLPWYLDATSSIDYVGSKQEKMIIKNGAQTLVGKDVYFLPEVTYDTAKKNVSSIDYKNIKNFSNLKFIAKTNYFRKNFSSHDDVVSEILVDETIDNQQTLATSLDISNVKLLASDRIITTTEFDTTLKASEKTLLPGDVNFQTSEQMNYIVFSPNTNYIDFYLDSESGKANLRAGELLNIYLPSRSGDDIFANYQDVVKYITSLGISGDIDIRDSLSSKNKIITNAEYGTTFGSAEWTIITNEMFGYRWNDASDGYLNGTAAANLSTYRQDADSVIKKAGLTMEHSYDNPVDNVDPYNIEWGGSYVGAGLAGYHWDRKGKILSKFKEIDFGSTTVNVDWSNNRRLTNFKKWLAYKLGIDWKTISINENHGYKTYAKGHAGYIEHGMSFEYEVINETYPSPVQVTLSKDIQTNDFSYVKTPVVFDKWAWRKQLWKNGLIPSQTKKIHLNCIDSFSIVSLNELIISSIWGTKFTLHISGRRSYEFEALNKDDETIAMQRIILY